MILPISYKVAWEHIQLGSKQVKVDALGQHQLLRTYSILDLSLRSPYLSKEPLSAEVLLENKEK